VFESIGYLHVDNQIKNKLDEKRKKISLWDMILRSKNINFITLKKKNMMICRDVEFDEEKACD